MEILLSIDIVDIILRLGVISLIMGLIFDKIKEKKNSKNMRKIIRAELDAYFEPKF
ncbi:MAG: hypothetical protein IIC67_07185 [Thaumarchaeota archaeon]|nr:hypothetical protein [Nitrososphaerota archaeon]